MATPSRAHMIGQLKDQRVDALERLQLARTLWTAEGDIGPNKHQVIVDCVISVLISKKKNELTVDVEREVWLTLSTLLQSLDNQQGSNIHLRPTIAQVVVEKLEREVKGEVDEGGVKEVVECCHSMVLSPNMASVFTGRIDIMVWLCSLLCQLSLKAPSLPVTPVLSQVTTLLWQQHHRSQFHHAQVLQHVTQRLVQPVLQVVYRSEKTGVPSTHADLLHTANSLLNFVLASALHQSQHKSFKLYLDGCRQQQKQPVDGHISAFFAKLTDMLQHSTDTSDRQAALFFIPKFFSEAVTVWRQDTEVGFELFGHLTTLLGVSAETATEKSTLQADSVDTVRCLLNALRTHAVYNVAVDRAADGQQLAYLRHLLRVLLSCPLSVELCGCFVELLELNHLIVEPCVQDVFTCLAAALSQVSGSAVLCSADRVMSGLVTKYSQLHQLPQFYSFLLQLCQRSPHHVTGFLALSQFSAHVHKALGLLTQTATVELWEKIQGELVSITGRVVNQQSHSETDEVGVLWGVSVLLHHFLGGRVGSNNTMSTTAARVSDLLVQLEKSVVSPLLELAAQSKSAMLWRVGLLLAVSLGEERLCPYMTAASGDRTPVLSEQLPFSLSLHSNKKLKKAATTDFSLQFLLDVMLAQQLEVSFREGGQVDLTPLISGLADRINLDQLALKHWDTNVWSVSEDTYTVARLSLLTRQQWISTLVDRHGAALAQLLVPVLTSCFLHDDDHPADKGDNTSTKDSADKPGSALGGLELASQWCITVVKLSTHCPAGPDFLHAVLCEWWQQWSATVGSSPKMQAVCRQLADSAVDWEQPSGREVLNVISSIHKIITSEKGPRITLTQTHRALLHVLEALPLTGLSPGSKLQCGLGLLTLLHSVDREDVRKSHTHPHSAPGLLCGLVTLVLDVSVGSSLIGSLTPSVLLRCIFSLATQTEADQQSPVGTVLDKAVAMVMRDYSSILQVEDFITHVQHGLTQVHKKVKDRQTTLTEPSTECLLTTTYYILTSMRQHMKKGFHRDDVQTSCKQYFNTLSQCIDKIADASLGESTTTTGVLPPVFLRCVTAVTEQRCLLVEGVEEGCESLPDAQLRRLQTLVDRLQLVSTHSQTQTWQKVYEAELGFVSCLYRHHAALQTALSSHTNALWSCLLNLLTQPDSHQPHSADANSQQSSQRDSSHSSTKRSTEVGDNVTVACGRGGETVDSGPARKRQKVHAKESASQRDRRVTGDSGDALRVGGSGLANGSVGGLLESIGGSSLPSISGSFSLPSIFGSTLPSALPSEVAGTEVRDSVLDCAEALLSSCTPSLFSQLLQQLLEAKDRAACGVMCLWQRLVECQSLSVQHTAVLEALAPQVVGGCVDCLQQGGVQPSTPKLLSILQCLHAMLTKHKFLSSRGTVQSLVCVSLVQLDNVTDIHWVVLMPAVCQVLHAVILHHPHTALRLSHTCLSVLSALVKQCTLRGQQKALGSHRADFVAQVAHCADSVSRLLALISSHENELQRVVATVIADYTSSVSTVTLHPEVKKCLLTGVYACLDKCDRHAIDQLRQRLNPGMKQVFHMLHQDFNNYYKYAGKA